MADGCSACASEAARAEGATCASGTADCVLHGKTALIIAADGDAWNALSLQLDGLGLIFRSRGTSRCAPLLLGEPVDLVLLDADFDVEDSFKRIEAIVADRPWVPVFVTSGSGSAVRIHSGGDLQLAGNAGSAGAPQSLRSLVVQALCRRARHAQNQRRCLNPSDDEAGHG